MPHFVSKVMPDVINSHLQSSEHHKYAEWSIEGGQDEASDVV